MKALSIKQPWAWLIANGYKDVENRDWLTLYRGRVLIHAGKSIDTEGLAWVRRQFPEIALPDTFETGGIVGVARINDCSRTVSSPWFCGKYGFVMTDRKPLPLMSCRGQLGFFEVSDDELRAFYEPILKEAYHA